MFRCITLASLLLLGLGGVLPAHAQAQRQHGSDSATAASVPWASLDPAAREMLAPLRGKWDHMSARHQQHLIDKSRHWQTLPDARRHDIRERIQRWQQMTPAEQRQARENRRVYHELPRQQRQKLHSTYRQFQHLPPAKRDRLLREWRGMSVDERQQWIQDHPRPHRPRSSSDGDHPAQ